MKLYKVNKFKFDNILLSVALFLGGAGFGIEFSPYNVEKYTEKAKVVVNIKQDTIPKFISQSPKEGLCEALKYYNIKHPDIVYRQAILETGNFTSGGCKKDNNLFGLYNSRKGKYYTFKHWSESVEAYKKYIQSKYKSGDYYQFLKNLGYAEDPNYIKKLKSLETEDCL